MKFIVSVSLHPFTAKISTFIPRFLVVSRDFNCKYKTDLTCVFDSLRYLFTVFVYGLRKGKRKRKRRNNPKSFGDLGSDRDSMTDECFCFH